MPIEPKLFYAVVSQDMELSIPAYEAVMKDEVQLVPDRFMGYTPLGWKMLGIGISRVSSIGDTVSQPTSLRMALSWWVRRQR